LREEEESGDSRTNKKRRRRRPIEKVNYDALHRPAVYKSSYNSNGNDDEGEDVDGKWETGNPVDPTTGLWCDPSEDSNHHNSNHGADWADLVPTFLQHGYESSLGLKDMTANPLLLIERSYNPPPLRQQLLEILMEECNVPATFFGKDAIMSCYSCGRTTSTVVDIGYSGTTVTPVYEGYVEQKGIIRTPIGSKAMDELALTQLQALTNNQLKPLYQVRNNNNNNNNNIPKRRDAFHRLALLDIARECRGSGAGQSINTAASKSLQVPSMSFALPDGETVDIPSQNRFAVANLVVGAKAGDEDRLGALRQKALDDLQTDFNSIIESVSAEDDDDDDDDDGDGEDNGNDDDDMSVDSNDQDERQKQARKYTEASAVGVSSRRTTRATRGSKAAAAAKAAKAATKEPALKKKGAASSNKVKFHNRVLNRACTSYLQSLSEQLTVSPIANMVCDAAFRCDRDQQANVLGNVVLSGGGACIGPTDQAVPDLLREQIEAIIHTHTPGWRVKVLSPGIQERAICSWLGGSILGSLGTFHDMWITKAEYEEWGSAIVNRKCP
jgi:actin-related protein